MRKGSGIVFPVLAVKLVDGDVEIHPIVQATPRHRKSVLIGSRDIEAFDPARLAKAVFCPARIERVLAEIVSAFQEPESRGRDNHMNVAAHCANRTIAIFHVKRVGKIDFETHRLAVTTASMGFQLFHCAAITSAC